MGISKEQLQAIIGGKARELCSPQGDRVINEAVKANRNGGGEYYDEDPSNYDDDADYFDSLYTASAGGGGKKMYSGDIQVNESGFANSRMDDKIKKSLMEHPIDRSALDPNRSVLAGMDIPPRKKQQRQAVNEQVSYSNNAGGVDYSIIKAIVNECLNEYFSRKPINEGNTLSTIGLKDGVIKLVDNKGNIFSAKLERLGNTKNL